MLNKVFSIMTKVVLNNLTINLIRVFKELESAEINYNYIE